MHAAIAFAATGREAALANLMARMKQAASREDANAVMTRDVGLPLAGGIVAFAQGRYADSVALVEPMRDHAHRFGGSHAQRDIVTLTLIEAALRSGDAIRARHYTAERLVRPGESQWGRRLWSRAAVSPRFSEAAQCEVTT